MILKHRLPELEASIDPRRYARQLMSIPICNSLPVHEDGRPNPRECARLRH
jgi:hypothetical protein